MKTILPLALFCCFLSLIGCNLVRDVELQLPEYTPQPVVECYLEPGKPFRLLLTQSALYYDPIDFDSSSLFNILLQGAEATISYNGQTDTLYNVITIEKLPYFINLVDFKIFNYTGLQIVPDQPGMEFNLKIRLPDGKSIHGRTFMLPTVLVDSTRIERQINSDTLYRAVTYFTDQFDVENYYRILINYQTVIRPPVQNVLVPDRYSPNSVMGAGTEFDLSKGDTAIASVFNLDYDYYQYLKSIQLATLANLNPFSQPSIILGNVHGDANPVGIFTSLRYDRDTAVVQ